MGTNDLPLTPQAGQPAEPPAQPETDQTPEVNAPLTAEQIRDIARALVGDPEISKQFKRSLFQHADARVEQAINQRLAALQEMGVQPTLDQVAQISAQAQRELQSPSPPPSVAQPTGAPPVQPVVDEQLDPIAQVALARMEEANTIIEDTDPEVSTINLTTTDPVEYLKSVDEAIRLKQERLAKKEDPALRVPGAGGGTGDTGAIPEGLSPYELAKLGYEQNAKR